ncbi:MAG: hypothetical protein AAF462_00960 [Thermodesulfobacteriota bacterium]
MRKFILGLFFSGLSIFLIIANMGGCSDTPCNLNFNLFLNGPSIMEQDSEWDCKRGGETVFTMGLFADLTGTRSDIGDFTYDRNKCRTIQFQNEEGSGILKNIQGSPNLGTLSFKQVSDDFGDTEVICDLVEF